MFSLQNKPSNSAGRKKIIIKILLVKVFILSFVFLGSQTVLARPTLQNALPNVGTVATGAGVGDKKDISVIASSVITTVLSIVGILFFILIVYGGFNWMMARGNDAQIKKSKDTVFAAVIGLVVILGAYAITTFVGGIIKS